MQIIAVPPYLAPDTLSTMDETAALPPGLSAVQVAALLENGAVGGTPLLVLDTRDGIDFEKGSVPSSIFCGYDGPFEEWMGVVFPDAHLWRVVVICYPTVAAADIRDSLVRVGFRHVLGYLQGGFEAWRGQFPDRVSTTQRIEPSELAAIYEDGVVCVDVSTDEQVAAGTWRGSIHLPLLGRATLDHIVALDAPQVYLFCTGAYRSLMVKTLLETLLGYTKVVEVRGGYMGMQRCPSCTPYLTA